MKQLENLPQIPVRENNSHKGSYGHILVVAGSCGMMGAACLTALAGLRSGSGLVTLATPKSQQTIAAIKLTCVMTKGLSDDGEGFFTPPADEEITQLASKVGVVALGPGIGLKDGVRQVISQVISHVQNPVVVDADGLNCLVGKEDLLKKRQFPTILTPHPGEFSRLTNIPSKSFLQDALLYAQRYAIETNTVVVLKHWQTVVTDGEQYFINQTGNPGMATAGSGDVLTGIISALVAQKFSPFLASALGVHIHGLAGDLAAQEMGQASMIASDIVDYLPKAFIRYSSK